MNTFENEDITFYVFRSDENEPSLEKCVYYEQGKTDDNGNFSADFVLNIPSSDCVAVLSSRRHEQFERLNFYYVNKKHLENTISDINKADSSAALGAVLENAWSEIGADSELIGKVSDKPIRANHYDGEHGNKHFISGIETVMEYAENLPAADVAPVVRCRDCEHMEEMIGGLVCTFGACADCVVPEEFYCGYGKRKDGGAREREERSR